MKITKRQLEQIIREESTRQLSEGDYNRANIEFVATKIREALGLVRQAGPALSELIYTQDGSQLAGQIAEGQDALSHALRILDRRLSSY